MFGRHPAILSASGSSASFMRALQPAAWFRADTGVTVTGLGASMVADQADSDNALVLPGVSGNYASAPDSVPLSITGDIDIRVRVALDDWTPGATSQLISKYGNAGDRAYYLAVTTTGALISEFSGDGTAATAYTSSSVTGFTNGTTHWVRITHNSTTGDALFYTSDDDTNDPTAVTWTQLGNSVAGAATTIFNGTAPVEVGARTGGATHPSLGKIYRAIIKSGIDGTTVFDANFAAQTKGTTSFSESSSNAATVTVNQSGALPAHIGSQKDLLQGTDASRPPYLSYSGTKYLYLPGVAGNYASTPDSVAASITGDIDIRVRVALDDWTPSATQVIVAKLATAGNYSYDFYIISTGELTFRHSQDGTALITATSSSATGLTDKTAYWIRATRASASGDVIFYTAADSSSEPSSWTKLGNTISTAAGAIFDGNTANTVGANAAGTAPTAGKLYRAIIKNGIDGTTVVDFNPDLDASDASTSFASSATGETWTVNKGSSGLIAHIVGRNWIMGDGSADILATAGFTLNQPLTRFIVGKSLTWTLNDYIADGNAKDSAAFIQSATTPRFKISAGSAVGENAGLALNTLGVMCAVVNGASSLTQVNLGTPVTGNAGAANAGGLTLFGSGTVATGFWNGMIVEDITFPTALDATQRARVIQYLAGRHGIAL